MWLFTTFGFFSIVQKRDDDRLCVRARAADDLDRLRERYLPTLSATSTTTHTDYPHRAWIGGAELAVGLTKVAGDITYPNFKSAVRKELGSRRAAYCHDVWSAMYPLGQEQRPAGPRQSS